MGQPYSIGLSELQNLTLVPLKEHELVQLIKEESAAFTINRDKINQYVEDERKVSAYTQFYLPTNMPKLYFLLDRIVCLHGEDFLKRLSANVFVDIGSGPGTFSLALLFYLNEKKYPLPAIYLIDRSRLMLNQAEKIIKYFFPAIELRISLNELSLTPDKTYSLFFGHSLNELSVQLQDNYINIAFKNTNVSDVFWIEPGTPTFFQQQIRLREQLLKEKFSVLYPCPSSDQCPVALANNEQSPEWCHQILRVNHPAEIERISQLVCLDRKILPMCAMYFTKKINENYNKWLYPFRFLKETKFSFDYIFCGDFDQKSLVHKKGELLKKSLTKEGQKILKNRSLGYPLKKNDGTLEEKSDFFRVKSEIGLKEYTEE